jgi:hypothetical protein
MILVPEVGATWPKAICKRKRTHESVDAYFLKAILDKGAFEAKASLGFFLASLTAA